MLSDRSALALVQKLRSGTAGAPLYVVPDIGGNVLHSRLLTCPGYATVRLSNHPIAMRDIIRALCGMMIADRPPPCSSPALV